MGYYWEQGKRSFHRFVFSPYFGLRKFANAGLLFAQFGFLKNSKVVGWPLKLSFDPSSICQLQCPLCPTGQKSRGRSLGIMPVGKFKKLMDEMAPWLYEVDLNNWGEPFLNKGLIEMVEYAHGKRVRTSVNSNLNVVLSEKQAEQIVKSGLDVLYVSMDGVTQKVYEKYRKKGILGNVMQNIRLVAGKKKELGSKSPEIVWQFLVGSHNESQLKDLKAVKEKLGVDRLVVGAMRSDMGKEIFTLDREKVESLKSWLPKDSELSRYDYEGKQRKLKKKYCHFLWFTSVVNWNGSVSPCCGSYFEKFDFGNAFEEGFKAVWNKEKYRAARKAVAEHKPNGLTVCDNCIRTGFID